MLRMRQVVSICAVVAGLAFATPASADSVYFSAANGNLAAAALFETSGTDLVVTLTNTSTDDVLVPADVLTCLFFDISGPAVMLTPVSAILGPGSAVLFGGSDPVGVVGGEWEYEDSFDNPAPWGAAYGIGSSGLNLFGSGEMFPGSNLQGPAAVDGLQYGLVSVGDNPANGNAAVTGNFALIKHEVVFTLSGLPIDFDVNRIGNVNWQYGTSLTEPNLPEPTSFVLLALGGLALARRR